MSSNHTFTLQDNLRGFDLTFKTTFDLFSYKHLDDGTKLLIESLEVKDGDGCLDLGCGYGPIGIVMAKMSPKSKVILVDRDFLAFQYAKINCEQNKVANCEVRLSNGFSELAGQNFDVIAANLPTHVSKETLQKIIEDSKLHLNPGGKMYIGCTNRLRMFFERLVQPVFGDCEKVAHKGDYVVLLVVNK